MGGKMSLTLSRMLTLAELASLGHGLKETSVHTGCIGSAVPLSTAAREEAALARSSLICLSAEKHE